MVLINMVQLSGKLTTLLCTCAQYFISACIYAVVAQAFLNQACAAKGRARLVS